MIFGGGGGRSAVDCFSVFSQSLQFDDDVDDTEDVI